MRHFFRAWVKKVASAILADVEPGFQPGGKSATNGKDLVRPEHQRHTEGSSGRQDAVLYGRPGGPPLRTRPAVQRNWLGHGQFGKAPQVIEITPDKRVVWASANHEKMRTVSSVQVLDVKGDATRGQIWH